MITFRNIKYYSLRLIFLSACIIFVSNFWVITTTKQFIVQDSEIGKGYDLAVVLGTSYRREDGSANPYFDARIRTAAKLYHEKIVKKILVSGSNSSVYYNEPIRMKQALTALGVPVENIILDMEGTRTYASMVRTHKIFGYTKFVIVTQQYHCYRALYISRHYGMNPVALPAEEVKESGFTIQFREYLARVKAVFELYLRDAKLI